MHDWREAIQQERDRQEGLKAAGVFKWTCADSEMDDHHRLVVLAEEFGEVARAVKRHEPGLRDELIQVAAVAVAWWSALGGAADA